MNKTPFLTPLMDETVLSPMKGLSTLLGLTNGYTMPVILHSIDHVNRFVICHLPRRPVVGLFENPSRKVNPRIIAFFGENLARRYQSLQNRMDSCHWILATRQAESPGNEIIPNRSGGKFLVSLGVKNSSDGFSYAEAGKLIAEQWFVCFGWRSVNWVQKLRGLLKGFDPTLQRLLFDLQALEMFEDYHQRIHV